MNLAKLPNERKLTLCRKYYMALVLVQYTWRLENECGWLWPLFVLGSTLIMWEMDCIEKSVRQNVEVWFPPIQCRQLADAGFAFLPFMWAINAIWFLNEAFWAPTYPEQKHIRRYVIISAVGALMWLVGLISWVVVFQHNRSAWGATADYMSFIIPKGVP